MKLLEIMAKAARRSPDFWVRVNHLRDDGLIFEVGHNPDPEVVDPVVVSALSDHGDANVEASRLTWEARIRAALLALAGAELPDDIIEASAEACSDARAASIEKQIEFRERNNLPQMERYGVAPDEWLPPTFRAMLRAIAEDKS